MTDPKSDSARFPILGKHAIKSIPWSLLEPHRAQAHRNHGQTLERLAERGGLSPREVIGVIEGINWGALRNIDETDAVNKLLKLMLPAIGESK